MPGRFDGCERFTIAEFGFGTGLNFLTTLAAWQERTNLPDLTFVTFELFPMTGEQLARGLAAFPELAPLADELLQAWSPEPGWNSLKLPEPTSRSALAMRVS